MKVGFGIARAVVVAMAVVIGLFIFKRRKLANDDDVDEETIDVVEDTINHTVTQNPLSSFMDVDDPFKNEFE